mgnify:CR=1 FL=1
MIQLKSPREIEIMAHGGAILGGAIALMRREVRPGVSTWEVQPLTKELCLVRFGPAADGRFWYGLDRSILRHKDRVTRHPHDALKHKPDGPLEEALAARSGNALMTAFELLARQHAFHVTRRQVPAQHLLHGKAMHLLDAPPREEFALP